MSQIICNEFQWLHTDDPENSLALVDLGEFGLDVVDVRSVVRVLGPAGRHQLEQPRVHLLVEILPRQRRPKRRALPVPHSPHQICELQSTATAANKKILGISLITETQSACVTFRNHGHFASGFIRSASEENFLKNDSETEDVRSLSPVPWWYRVSQYFWRSPQQRCTIRPSRQSVCSQHCSILIS